MAGRDPAAFSAVDLLGWTPAALNTIEQLRGWTETAIEQLELSYLPDEHRVGIPIRDELGDELGLLRYDPTGTQRPKMRAPAGAPRCLFPPPELVADTQLDEHRTIWLVEGEPDAIRLWSLGIPAIGVPGAQNWRDEWAARFTDRHRWRVVVCFDCDAAGRAGAERIAGQIVNGGGDARLVDLDPGRQDGYDLTDWTRSADTPALRDQAAAALRAIAATTELYDPPAATNTNGSGPAGSEPSLTLTIQTLEEFAAVDEPGARELVGGPGQALVPEGANVMIYGDGGAGKTTLTIDLACHLGAGDDWIGIAIAATARSLIIEDEGPRAFFRRKLARKLDGWVGSSIEGRVLIVEKPWASFTFAEEHHRAALAQTIDHHDLDIVFVGPVVVAGMEKAGTLHDVRDFLALVDDVRKRSHRRNVTFVLVHHENKGGEVSGAWEGAGDTLIHLNAQGHGKTRLHIQKARQAPDYHLKTLTLKWTDGEGFEIEEKDELDDDQLEAKIVAAVGTNPGVAWTKVEERTSGVNAERRRLARNRLLDAGTLINVYRDVAYAYCEKGKTTSLHTSDDPEIAHLLPARRRGERPGDDGLF